MNKGIISGRIDIAKVQGLLFDVDGTLSDTDDIMIRQVMRWISPFAWLFKNHDPHDFARGLVMAIETPANFIYTLADRLHFDSVVARIYNEVAQNRQNEPVGKNAYKLIPGVKEMLETLNGRIPMAVVSARDAHTTERFLECFNLHPYFDAIVTSQTCRYTKPFPDPVAYAAEQLGLPPEGCLMIGDTIVDVRSAKAAGSQTVAVLCGFGSLRELQRAGADLILSNTPDLLNILPF